MARQRCVIAALAETADPLHLFSHLPQILETAQTHITTDFPLNLVPDLIRLAGRTSADEIRVIGFDATWGDGRTPTGAVIPDVQRVRDVVRRTLVDPDSAAELGVTTADEACG
jgi:anionic cell wall polymer biosynthesis LytR-Cps2A-Psr (LCP) family protein